jgi:hypothetical protein
MKRGLQFPLSVTTKKECAGGGNVAPLDAPISFVLYMNGSVSRLYRGRGIPEGSIRDWGAAALRSGAIVPINPPLNAVGDNNPELLNDAGAVSEAPAGAATDVGGLADELEGGDTRLPVPPGVGTPVVGAVLNRPGGGPNPTGLLPGIDEGLNSGGGATAGAGG